MVRFIKKIIGLLMIFILLISIFNLKFELALTVLETLPNETKFVDIAAGYSHSLALDESGNVWTWGDYNSIHMIKIDGQEVKFKAISAGTESSLAIDTNGNLWGWGKIMYESTSVFRQPIKIMEGTKFKKIAACWNYNLAIDEDGNLWSWGNNSYGQLGIGHTNSNYNPKKVKEGTKFKEIAGEYFTSLAIDSSNNLWAWGAGQSLGIGINTSIRSTPVLVKSETKFSKIAEGEIHSLAIDSLNNLWAWGGNNNCDVGDGTTIRRYTPVHIKRGTTFKEIAGGDQFSLAIDSSNNLWAWGYNNVGQIGNNTQNNVSMPTQILNGTKFIKVAAGRAHSLALSEDGNLWIWGSNEYKQLTTSSISNSLTPVKIVSKKVEYTVTFVDGTQTIKTESVISGGSATAPILEKEGYTLSWDKDFSNVTGNLTITATWIPNKHTVTINTNEGKKELEYTNGEDIFLPQNLTKPGYTFEGWYDNEEFKGDKVTQITIEDAQNNTYYIKWKENNDEPNANNIINDINNIENTAPGILPQTGIQNLLFFILITIFAIIMFVSFIKYRNSNI